MTCLNAHENDLAHYAQHPAIIGQKDSPLEKIMSIGRNLIDSKGAIPMNLSRTDDMNS